MEDAFGYGPQQLPLLRPGLADDALGGSMATLEHDEFDPASRQRVVVSQTRISGQVLTCEPGNETLFQLPHHALDLAFGLGSIRSASSGHDAEQPTAIYPFRSQDGGPIGGLTNDERAVTVGENLARHTAEVMQAPEHTFQTRLPSAVGREADRRRPAVAEDGHHG